MQSAKLIISAIKVAIIISIIVSFLGFLGISPFKGCYFRYADNTAANTTVSLTLNANGVGGGDYQTIGSQSQTTSSTTDVSYGRWTKVNLAIKADSSVYFYAKGEVSLCQAKYIGDGSTVIPRVGDNSTMAVLLPASSSATNITEVYPNDYLKITIGPNTSSSSYYVSTVNGGTNTVNCSDGQTSYDARCGKYTYYNGVQYVSGCTATGYKALVNKDRIKPYQCSDGHVDLTTPMTNNGYTCWEEAYRAKCETSNIWPYAGTCNCSDNTCAIFYYDNAYIAYSPSALFLNSDSTSLPTTSGLDGYHQCPSNTSPNFSKFWFAFDQYNGSNTNGALNYSISNTSISNSSVNIIDNCGSTNNATGCHNFSERYILDNTSSGGVLGLTQQTGILSYSFQGQQSYSYPTTNGSGTSYGNYNGGYVVYVQQTKCRRVDGSYSSDPAYSNRGAIRFLLLDDGVDPNSSSSSYLGEGAGHGTINFISGASSQTSPLQPNQDGTMWLRIDNKNSDYINSTGSYQIDIVHNVQKPVNNNFDLWNWIYNIFTNTFNSISQKMFKNLTCYGGDKSNCTNFFNVIKAFLFAYIVIFGMQFSLGIIQMDAYDFIIRIIKLLFIGGLMSGQTFDFFNNYIYGIVYGFSNSLMNSAAFFPSSAATGANGLGTFIMDILNVFGQDIFQIQFLAMLGTGFTGIMNLILIMISIVLFLLPIFNLMAVSLISYFFVSLLLGLAPIFLIFLLFQPTRYLFDNWIKHLIAYIAEPIILFIGIVILAKLYLVYLDYVFGYSVCFKCNAAFSIPFLTSFFPALNVLLNTMPIFCVYWISPWGYDTMSYNYGLALTNVISLFSIGSATYYYTTMCSSIVGSIFGGSPVGSEIHEKTSGAAKAAMSAAKQAASKAKQKMQSRGGAGGGSAGGGGGAA